MRRVRSSVLITSLASSRTEDIRMRERRYVQAMLLRVVFLVAAVLVFHGTARFVAIGIAIFTPGFAVIFANQPRRSKAKPELYEPARVEPPGLGPGREHRVIDPD